MMAEAVNVEVVGLFSYFPFFLSFFLSVPLFLLFLVVRWRLLLLLSVVFLLLVLLLLLLLLLLLVLLFLFVIAVEGGVTVSLENWYVVPRLFVSLSLLSE